MMNHALVAAALLCASSITVAATASASLSDMSLWLIDPDTTDDIAPRSFAHTDRYALRWDTDGASLGRYIGDTDYVFGEIAHDAGRPALTSMTTAVLSGPADTFAQGAAHESALARVGVTRTSYRGAQRNGKLPGFGPNSGSSALAGTAGSDDKTRDFSLTFANATGRQAHLADSDEVSYIFNSVAAPTPPVPESAPFALVLAGLGLVALVARRHARLAR